jgi:hypothetical protein
LLKGTHLQSTEDTHKKTLELKHFHKRISGDAMRPGRLVWQCVASDRNYFEGDNM